MSIECRCTHSKVVAEELRFYTSAATEVKCTFYVRTSFFTLADTQFTICTSREQFIPICAMHYMKKPNSLSINVCEVGGFKVLMEGYMVLQDIPESPTLLLRPNKKTLQSLIKRQLHYQKSDLDLSILYWEIIFVKLFIFN